MYLSSSDYTRLYKGLILLVTRELCFTLYVFRVVRK